MAATVDNPFKRCPIIINDSSLSQQNLHSTGSQALARTSSPPSQPRTRAIYKSAFNLAQTMEMAEQNVNDLLALDAKPDDFHYTPQVVSQSHNQQHFICYCCRGNHKAPVIDSRMLHAILVAKKVTCQKCVTVYQLQQKLQRAGSSITETIYAQLWPQQKTLRPQRLTIWMHL